MGIGIGWSSEEFAALGIPFRGRSRRMQGIRRGDRGAATTPRTKASLFGLIGFPAIPSPTSMPQFRLFLEETSVMPRGSRLAAYGDGWYGFNFLRR